MRRALLLSTLLFCFSAGVVAQSSQPASKGQAAKPVATIAVSPSAVQAARASFAKLPLSFEENSGQTDERVKFLSRAANYNLFLTGDEAVLALRSGNAHTGCAGLASRKEIKCARGEASGASKDATERGVLWLKMLGGNGSAQITGTDPLPGKINYYVGNDPSKWRIGVRQFGRVSYRGIYPGVDLTYYGNERQLESDFVVAPGADAHAIEFEVRGAREIRLDEQGNLVLATSAGNVQLLRPAIYQTIKGVRHDISGRYLLHGNDRIGFEIAKYDPRNTLIIDPKLVYATYLGGSNTDEGDGAQAIAVDGNGHAYVTGQGTSSDFPGSDASGVPIESLITFAFVTELDATGSSGAPLVYSTILSGSIQGTDENTIGNGIGLDSSGNAYVAGVTGSSNFPMVNPYQATFGGAAESGFVAGLKSDGTLIYSTYLGGRNGASEYYEGDATVLQGLFADSAGNAYVTGNTNSQNFPTVNPYQSTLNVTDIGYYTNVVVAKFNPQGQPVYSTYLNGAGSDDLGIGIVADSAGNAYVAGQTTSAAFPLQTSPAPFQATLGGSANVFVTKLSFNTNTSTLSLAASTYLGGSGSDEGMAIAIDSASPPNVYLTGQTTSPNFPTKNPIFAANAGGTDSFATKLSGNFTSLVYSTYLGGSGTDIGYGIALDTANPPDAYIAGSTNSTNFPLAGSLQAALGGASATNVFVTEVNGAGSALTYSTYLGGISADEAHAIALDSSNNAYIAGQTTSVNFPVLSGGAAGTNPFQGQLGTSQGNAFVAKISPLAALAALNFFPLSYNFHNVGVGASATELVTLTNNTAASATINSFTIGGTNAGDFSLQAASAPCSTTASFALPAGSSCVLTIKFAPMDQDGRSGQLSINSTPSSSSVLNLAGTGGAPQVSLSATSITFFPNPDPLNIEATASVTLTNTGGGPLQIGSAQIQASTPANAAVFSAPFNESSCFSGTIAPSNSCYIDINFIPTTAGAFNATLLINTNAAGSPDSVSLTGVGVQEVLVTPPTASPIQFGTQVVNSTTINNDGVFEVENGSGETITLTITPGAGPDQGDFHVYNTQGVNTCTNGMALAPGGECETILYFQPTAASATNGRTGSYTVGWTGTAIASVVPGSQLENLEGTGVSGVSLSTYTLSAGNQYLGITTSGFDILYNGTNSPITVNVTLSGNNPGDFTSPLESSCAPGGVIPANSSCYVYGTFTPSALGLRTATASFAYTGDNGVPLTLSLSGTGIPGPVLITVNGEQVSSNDFGSEIIGTTTPETKFLLRNIAKTPLAIQSIAAPGNTDFKITSDSTCAAGGAVPGGGTCFVGLTFTPSTNTNTRETTSFVITDAYTSTGGADLYSPHTLTLFGTGEPAVITVSVSSGGQNVLDFGNVALNPSPVPQGEIFLTNAGNTPTTITWSGGSPALTTTSGTPFSLVASGANVTTCTQNKVVLSQGGSCLIGVQFNPAATGEQFNSVTFTDSVTETAHTVSIQGNGVGQGKISLSPTTSLTYVDLNFAQLAGTTSSSQTVTVYNIGSAPLTITSLPEYGTNTSSFNILGSSTCAVGTVIQAGSNCIFNITFTAPLTPGNSDAELEVVANLGNNVTGDVVPELAGTSLAGGVTLSPAGTIAFGAVADGSTEYNSNFFSLTNNFPSSVTFGTLQLPAGYAATYDGCSGMVVSSGSSCDFELSFSPTSSTTNYNGNLSITFTGTGVTGSPFTVPITGSGSATVAASPNPVVFQYVSVGSTYSNSVTITNGSASAATITAIGSFTGANPGDFSIPSADNFCPSGTVLTAANPTGGSCFLEVSFLSSTPGNFSAQFTVSYSIGGHVQTPITIMVSASIPSAQATVTPTTLIFPGQQTVNTQSQALFVTLSNSASAGEALAVSNLQIIGTDFEVLTSVTGGNCDYLPAGQSCTIPVAFTPSKASLAPNDRTGTLTITDNSTTSPHVITLEGTGANGGLLASTTGLTFPQTTVGSSVTLAVQLSNSGPAVTFNGVTFTGPYSAGTGQNACPAGGVIPAVTGSCIVYITFTPNGGSTIGTAVVNYNTSSSLAPISLSGALPIINSLSPTSATAGAAGFTLTVTGANFISGSVVNFNGSAAPTTFVSATQLTASITAADITSAGWDQITVTSPGAGGGTSNAVAFPVLPGSTSPITGSALRYVPVTPCRLVDTRNTPDGAFAGPSITGGTSRSFIIPQDPACTIPSTAAAYSLNVAVIPAGPLGYVTLWPTGQTQPLAATLSSVDGRVRSNAAIVPAGTSGAVSVFASNTTDLVMDIDGYFTTATSALEFYPVTPCRLVDTRNASGTFGGPSLAGNTSRTFPLPTSPCNLPSTAQAYSLNLTAVPQVPLGYLTAWPTGLTQPGTANLSAPTGTVTSNAAIVPAGTSGSINVYASNTTDLVIDVDGYFAPAGTGGLSLYNLPPCRVLDTRQVSDTQSSQPFTGELDEDIQASACGVPVGAQAYVLNATVVPSVPLGYLTLWPQGTAQPLAATLSALDQTVTSNLAIVPTTNLSISTFAANPIQLVLDIFGYFAP